jgi:hypothetical protein
MRFERRFQNGDGRVVEGGAPRGRGAAALIRHKEVTVKVARQLIAAVSCAWLLVAGCGGGDDLDTATVVDGVVEAPDGEIVHAQGLWDAIAAVLIPKVLAITGLEPVGAGEDVRLEVIDGAGEVINLLATQSTRADGSYSHPLASAEQPGSSLVVSVGEDQSLMRAFVASESVDINPATEATVRLVLDSGDPPGNFSAAELTVIQEAVDEATDDVAAGMTIATANARAEQRAGDDPEVQAAIATAGAS